MELWGSASKLDSINYSDHNEKHYDSSQMHLDICANDYTIHGEDVIPMVNKGVTIT